MRVAVERVAMNGFRARARVEHVNPCPRLNVERQFEWGHCDPPVLSGHGTTPQARASDGAHGGEHREEPARFGAARLSWAQRCWV